MLKPNLHYAELKDSYLFHNISLRIEAFLAAHLGTHLLRMGIGDVSLPLCPAVIEALHEAVEDQAKAQTFHGYMPECGAPFLRSAVVSHYETMGVHLSRRRSLSPAAPATSSATSSICLTEAPLRW